MKGKRKPVNTERLAAKVPSMQSWTRGGAPNKILVQEHAGQSSFVDSDTLPTDFGHGHDCDVKAILEAAGVKFLGVVPDDPIFQYVKLPKDWKKMPTEHSMWSHLVDDKGRIRARIFYKAAFYDRSATLSLSMRFGVQMDYKRQEKEKMAVAQATDCGKVIYATEPIPLPTESHEKFKVIDQANEAAIAWLNRSYPGWKNPAAYWD